MNKPATGSVPAPVLYSVPTGKLKLGFRATFFVICAASIYLTTSPCFAADAQTPSSPVVPTAAAGKDAQLEMDVSGFEHKFFGEIYLKDTLDQRMDRLEKFVYGSVRPGTWERRIGDLKAAMLQKSPDGTPAAPLPVVPEDAPAKADAGAVPKAVTDSAAVPVPGATDLFTTSSRMGATAPAPDTDLVAPVTPVAAAPTEAAAGASSDQSQGVPPDAIDRVAFAMPAMPAPVLQSGVRQDVPGAAMPAAATLSASGASSFAAFYARGPQNAPTVETGPLHLSLAAITSHPDDPKRLIQSLADAIETDPVFTADLYFQKAQAELFMKDYKSALKDLTDAILKEPMRYKYYLARAIVYQKIGNSILAEKDIATARYTYKDLPTKVEFDADTRFTR